MSGLHGTIALTDGDWYERLRVFKCRSCGYVDNADVNAAKNILDRFLSGPYGAGF